MNENRMKEILADMEHRKLTGEPDEYGWCYAKKPEVEALIAKHDLVGHFHSIADMTIWYSRKEVATKKILLDCTAYIRRSEMADNPNDTFQINRKNVALLD